LLKWAAVPEESMKLSGMGDAYYQLLELEAVLESVTVVPKPAAKSQGDKGDIDDRRGAGDVDSHDRLFFIW
jgi:hypothetical protein